MLVAVVTDGCPDAVRFTQTMLNQHLVDRRGLVNSVRTLLGRPVSLSRLGGVLFAETVVEEIFCEVVVDFGRGDFRKSSIFVDCECVVGVNGGPSAGLDGATGGSTSRFFLFVPGSNHSVVDIPLTRVAPPRGVWHPATGDAVVSPE